MLRKYPVKFVALALTYVLGATVALVPTGAIEASGECNNGSHSGYTLIDQYNMYAESSTYRTGTLELYWSNTEGRNCAIARAYGSNWGERLWRGAYISIHGGTTYKDEGYYSYYAGPVYTPNSRGKCIDVQGTFRTSSNGALIGNRYLKSVHCS
jgi:hypothetical protein